MGTVAVFSWPNSAWESRMDFMFLKVVKQTNKKQRRMFDRDYPWPAKPTRVTFTMAIYKKHQLCLNLIVVCWGK